MNAEVTLAINGINFGGWTNVRINRGIEQISSSFSLGATDKQTGKIPSYPIKEGDFCQVMIDGDHVLAGAIDDRSVSYDKESHSIEFTGRDALGDLVDCSAKEIQINGNNLLQIAQTICKPFGISASVASGVDIGPVFKTRTAEPGQAAFDLLAELASYRGVLLIPDSLGNLVIAKPSSNKSAGKLVYGENILACSGRSSLRDRYSDYTVKSQGQQDAFSNGETSTQAHATANDAGMPKGRYRPLTLLVDEVSDMQKRADFERNVRAGRAKDLTYTVTGWHADEGILWIPNTLVPVTDPHQEPPLNNTDLLIVNVAYIDGEEGQLAELTVRPKGALDVLAVPQPDGGSSW